MKKKITIILLAVLVGSVVSCSFAEETQEQGGFFNSIGSFFSDTWNDAADWAENAWEDTATWVEGAWEDTTGWINGAWGDASEWVSRAWDDSSAWVGDIWGDVSDWVSETVTGWWVNTFDTVTDDSGDAWEWLRENAADWMEQGTELCAEAKAAVCASGEDAEEKLKETLYDMLEKLNINEAEADKVWKTIMAYAEQNDVSPIAVAKLSVPYVLQLCADNEKNMNTGVPAVAVAQYLTGVLEKLGMSEAAADELAAQLQEVFVGI